MTGRIFGWSAVPVLALLLLTSGCASTTVMTYVAGSTAEEEEAEALYDAAEQSTSKIRDAVDKVLNTKLGVRAALERLNAKKLPPGIKRPTQEDIEALRQAVTAAENEYRAIVKDGITVFEAYLEKYPKNWYARHRYAGFLADSNPADQSLRNRAAEQWLKVTEIEPRFPYAYNNLASLDHMGNEYDKQAFGWLRKAIELYDEDPVFYTNLAVHYSTHRYMAIEQFGWDKPRVFREIVHCYRRAIELEPENVEFAQALASHYILAKYFEVTDTADAEIEAWKYVLTLELTPVQRTRAMRAIGRVMFMSKGDLNSAEEWLQKALAIGDDPGCRSLLKLVQEARQGAGKGEQE